MKYIKSAKGFEIVANNAKVEKTTYVYNLKDHDDASEVLLHLMDIQATEWEFLHFGSNLGAANSKAKA